MTAPVDDLFEVRLLDLPLLIRERSRQHGADLLREMELITSGSRSGTTNHRAPTRLLELAQELDTVYAPFIASTTDAMDAALDRGDETMAEVRYRLPPSSVTFVRHIAAILGEVEEFCRAGQHLLILAPPADIQAYREWSISEIQRQYAGEAPTPWPAFAAARGL